MRDPSLLDSSPPRAATAGVAAVIADCMAWPEAPDPAPEWLLPAQVTSFRRGLEAVRRHGGTLLADAVGTGKTYVALAIAARLAPAGPIVVVAPAVLETQWRRTAGHLGLLVHTTSHERVSRGERIGPLGPVIVDECHRFRNPDTRRYRSLAPALVGRRAILVSATPVVNRMSDVGHQLRLAVRDDALRFHGLPSLGLLDRAVPPVAIGRLIVRSRPDREAAPEREDRLVRSGPDDPGFLPALQALDRLRLSSDRGVASLVRTSLYRSLGSSPAALLASIRRYRLLLEHAALARRAGRRVSRRELWRAAGVIPEQLVMWELLESSDDDCDLSVSDRSRLRSLEVHLARWAERGDRKTDLLKALLIDRAPTLVFTAAVETVGYLRHRLALSGTAWITGDRAGFGSLRAARQTVLDSFAPNGRPRAERPDAPWLLLATDVLAEGLDLQRVSRIVHYDLPWTSVRLEQRDGRALRRGSTHRTVAIVRFEPPIELESRIQAVERLELKARLPARIGLALGVDAGWHASDRLRRRFETIPREAALIAVEAAEPFAIAAAVIDLGTERFGLVLADPGTGQWTDDPALAETLLELAAARPALQWNRARLETFERRIRAALQEHQSRLQSTALFNTDPAASRASRRIRTLAEQASRLRSAPDLDRYDRALRFLHRGHTAGEGTLVQAIAHGDLTAIDQAPSADSDSAPLPRMTLTAAIAGIS